MSVKVSTATKSVGRLRCLARAEDIALTDAESSFVHTIVKMGKSVRSNWMVRVKDALRAYSTSSSAPRAGGAGGAGSAGSAAAANTNAADVLYKRVVNGKTAKALVEALHEIPNMQAALMPERKDEAFSKFAAGAIAKKGGKKKPWAFGSEPSTTGLLLVRFFVAEELDGKVVVAEDAGTDTQEADETTTPNNKKRGRRTAPANKKSPAAGESYCK